MNINLLLGIPDLHEDAFKPQGYGMKLFCGGGGGYTPPPPPPAPTPAAPVQQAVAPATTTDAAGNAVTASQSSDASSINANRTGKSRLRIDLDPLIAAARSVGAGGSGLGISG